MDDRFQEIRFCHSSTPVKSCKLGFRTAKRWAPQTATTGAPRVLRQGEGMLQGDGGGDPI